MFKRFWRLAGVCLMLLGTSIHGGRAAAQTVPGWSQVSGVAEDVAFVDLALVSRSLAWATAVTTDAATGQERGLLYRLSLTADGAWVATLEQAFDVPLQAIDVNGADDVWVLADYGRMLLYKNALGWHTMPAVTGQPRELRLTTLEMIPGGGAGWAAGGITTSSSGSAGPRLYRYSAGTWTQEPGVTGDASGAIRSLSVTDQVVWAFGGTSVWRGAQGQWTQEQIARSGCPSDLPPAACLEVVTVGVALDDQHAWALPSGANAQPHLLQRTPAGWQAVAANLPPLGGLAEIALEDLALSDATHGWAAGWTQGHNLPIMLHYADGSWSSMALPGVMTGGTLNAVSAIDNDHALAVGSAGLVLSYGYGIQSSAGMPCFSETNQCIDRIFNGYWERNGGLPVFGYPLSLARMELNADLQAQVLTQHFERNRLEYHPANAGTPYEILLGLLGKERLAQIGRNWSAEPREAGPKAGCRWFAETGHNVCNQQGELGFKTYWASHGLAIPGLDANARSLQLFGLPLTEPKLETNTAGDQVLTQWFERARFEWHPNNPSQFKVLLGLLDKELEAGR